MWRVFLICLTFMTANAVFAQSTDGETKPQPEPPMTLSTLAEIVTALDGEASIAPNGMALTIGNVPVNIITDVLANRMRILAPVASAGGLEEADLLRLMQANFDTALDARNAIANGRLWSTFIHPLSQLERDQFVSGLAQTVTLARNYGSSYSSGGVVFGGGDSGDLFRELLDRSQEL